LTNEPLRTAPPLGLSLFRPPHTSPNCSTSIATHCNTPATYFHRNRQATHCNNVQSNTLQHTATHYIVILMPLASLRAKRYCETDVLFAGNARRTLSLSLTDCQRLQQTAIDCLQQTANDYDGLQHTATHCNTTRAWSTDYTQIALDVIGLSENESLYCT